MTDAERELELDLALLAAAEREDRAHFRAWTTAQATVVLGRAVDVSTEVDEALCVRLGIPIVRRPSGGRSVLIGAGTVQYTYALPCSYAAELASIASTKRYCNRMVIAALARAAASTHTIEEDTSGDLLLGARKVAGLAMRRRRDAVLVHGTILVTADLTLIARALKHPVREPAYRRGRSHADFLANLGALDVEVFSTVARALLAEQTR